MRGKEAVASGHGTLVSSLADPSPYVRIVAAEALGRFGEPDDLALALRVLADHADWSTNDVFVAVTALNALDQFPEQAEAIKADLRKRPPGQAPDPRYQSYVPRLLEPGPN
jgi:uncharacterized sulfatase